MRSQNDRVSRNHRIAHRIAVLVLVWVAFGFRIFFAERLPYDYDRSYSHGVGLTILHQLGSGLSPTALLHSESSNSGLTNPALTNYVFALIGLFDRSPYTATVLTAALGAVIAAITYDLGRRCFGRTVGLIALALVAASPWSAFFARGAWYTGYFELSAVVPAWLLMKALLPRQAATKKILIAILSSAVLAHFYLVSFALVAQMAAVLFVARSQLRDKAKLVFLFIVAWLISFACIGVVVAANRSTNIRPDGLSLVYGNPSPKSRPHKPRPASTSSRWGGLAASSVGAGRAGWATFTRPRKPQSNLHCPTHGCPCIACVRLPSRPLPSSASSSGWCKRAHNAGFALC